MFATLDATDSPLHNFLKSVCAEYVVVMNMVMAHSPKSSPRDVRVELDDAQWRIDEVHVPRLWKKAWNQAAKQLPAACIDEYKHKEWMWVVNHLIVACRHCMSASIRRQFEDEQEFEKYVGDKVIGCTHSPPPAPPRPQHTRQICVQEDLRHAYYCIGAVLRSLYKKFSKSSRIQLVLNRLVLSKSDAVAQGLPTHECDTRYVTCSNFVVCIALHSPHCLQDIQVPVLRELCHVSTFQVGKREVPPSDTSARGGVRS